MCDLLKINENHMKAWLCNKRIKTVNEVVNTPLTLNQVIYLVFNFFSFEKKKLLLYYFKTLDFSFYLILLLNRLGNH